MERDRINDQLTAEIFDRLLTFGTESDRPLFCQRLQLIWEEQGIFCQAHPTITSQILDLYKLHRLVQDKQGYLEITTSRGWKEISNVLGFGDSGSAAYSVKRNYVRLGLLAYECRFDRAGIDPRSVIELSEMPHTVKKRKRGDTSTTRTIIKTHKQHPPTFTTQHDQEDMTKCSTHIIDARELPKHPPRSANVSPSCRFLPQQMSIHDFQQLAHVLRAGSLADCNDHLETLLVWLSDARTATYFNLKSLPGLFNAITEQYVACLYELFDRSFVQPSSANDSYMNWLLQLNFRVHDTAVGPQSRQQRLEALFFGTHRYVLRRCLTRRTEDDESEHPSRSPDRCHCITTRCSCLATIIRNLSFIEENEYLANDRRLLDILQRILTCHHQDMHAMFDADAHSSQPYFHRCPSCSEWLDDAETTPESTRQETEDIHLTDTPFEVPPHTRSDDPLACADDFHRRHLMYLLDNTFITLANLSPSIELRLCYPTTRSRLTHTVAHWISCSLSFADKPFIPMLAEHCSSTKKIDSLFVSARQLALQIFAKLCTKETNVDWILVDLTSQQLIGFSHALLSLMNSPDAEDINREYCLIIVCSLCKRNRPSVEFFCAHVMCIELIFNYLEFYEYNQQQYLIATLTSYCNASSQMPVNHSMDMMIDSCIQLLLLFASVQENNCLRSFESKLLDMSSSIYFEQRMLRAFADILYTIKS